ncbi:MAG: glycosyltransferase family 2 protein [Bauldia sp.]
MTLACLICAYNEEPHIGRVLSAVVQSQLFDEIAIVDDGSTDRTAEVVRGFADARLICLPGNRGKTAAAREGVRQLSSRHVMLLDADLVNLTPADLSSLAEPVLSDTADVSISLRGNAFAIYRLLKLDFASGERVLTRALLAEALAQNGVVGFGLEVAMNRLIVAKRLRLAVVPIPRVSHVRKAKKVGWIKGTIAEWRMVRDILRVMPPSEIVAQNYRMLALSRAGTRLSTKAAADASQE